MYPIVTSGKCTDRGYEWIEDKATCEAAAGQVGWSDTTVYTTLDSYYPRGCLDTSWGDLYFNTDTSSRLSA